MAYRKNEMLQPVLRPRSLGRNAPPVAADPAGGYSPARITVIVATFVTFCTSIPALVVS